MFRHSLWRETTITVFTMALIKIIVPIAGNIGDNYIWQKCTISGIHNYYYKSSVTASIQFLIQVLKVNRIKFGDTQLISPTAKFSSMPVFSYNVLQFYK